MPNVKLFSISRHVSTKFCIAAPASASDLLYCTNHSDEPPRSKIVSAKASTIWSLISIAQKQQTDARLLALHPQQLVCLCPHATLRYESFHATQHMAAGGRRRSSRQMRRLSGEVRACRQSQRYFAKRSETPPDNRNSLTGILLQPPPANMF